MPLFKSLPSTYGDFQRVKVRQKRKISEIEGTINEAFHDHYKISQRSIFANGQSTFENEDGKEPFYIFPINGFKFLYSEEVKKSSNHFQTVFEDIFDKIGEDHGKRLMAEVLRFSYVSEKLSEGITMGSEIIIYNIPFYYAIRTSTVDGYSDILNSF